jgi:hypothetical protein
MTFRQEGNSVFIICITVITCALSLPGLVSHCFQYKYHYPKLKSSHQHSYITEDRTFQHGMLTVYMHFSAVYQGYMIQNHNASVL